jgi:hypothetical protein
MTHMCGQNARPLFMKNILQLHFSRIVIQDTMVPYLQRYRMTSVSGHSHTAYNMIVNYVNHNQEHGMDNQDSGLSYFNDEDNPQDHGSGCGHGGCGSPHGGH